MLFEFDRCTLPSPTGPIQAVYIFGNLVQTQSEQVSVLDLTLPSSCLLVHLQFLLFFHWKCLLGFQAVTFNCDCTSCITGHSCLLPTLSSTTDVLLIYSGCVCLLPIQIQLQLYFSSTQTVVVFYQFMFNYSCTSSNYSSSVVYYKSKING
jgi:hypothetical protein